MHIETEVTPSSLPQLLQDAGSEAGNKFSHQHHQASVQARDVAQRSFLDEYIRRMNAPRFPSFTSAAQFLSYVTDRGVALLREEEGTEFTLTGDNLPVYQQLAAYFTGDYSTFSGELNPRKGLLIFGCLGCGKTVLMRLFGQNPRQSFRVVSAGSIAEDFRVNGDYGQYKAPFLNDSSHKFFGQREIGLCIDNAGTESVAANYANSQNVIAQILQYRCDSPRLRGLLTHMITNATEDELEKAYGQYVYSKLRQAFNVIEFPVTAVSLRS